MAVPDTRFGAQRRTPPAEESVVFSFPNEFDDRCSGSLLFDFVAIGSGEYVEPRVTLRWWAGDFPRPGSMARLLERACAILGRDLDTVLVREVSTNEIELVTS